MDADPSLNLAVMGAGPAGLAAGRAGLAHGIMAQAGDPACHARLRAETAAPPPDLSGGIKLVKTARHTHHADIDTCRRS